MLIKKKFKILDYYQKGNNPKLLIHSGTHGDEFEVIPFVFANIRKYLQNLPDLVYVPNVSPSAVRLKTRLNKNGSDLNRSFFNDAKDDEAMVNIELHKKFKFDLCVDFHKDPEADDFYMYDRGKFSKRSLLEFQKSIKTVGVDLFNGIDDPDDPVLGHKFEGGYKSFEGIKTDPTTGTFWDWSEINGIVKRIIVVEIPGMLEKTKKEKLVKAIFEKIILPLV